MTIPEIILFKIMTTFQEIVAEDYNEWPENEKQKSMLSNMFSVDDNGDTMKLGTYDYFKQSVAIFTKDSENARNLEISIGYNTQRLSLPTVHILLPAESRGKFDSIGMSEGADIHFETEQDSMITTKYKTFSSTYHLMITSDNSSEVLTIYYWLRAMFMLFSDHLNLKGLLNLQFSGADIQLTQEYVPNTIFHRNLSLSFDFESKVRIRLPKNLMTKFNVRVCQDLSKDINDYTNNL